MGRSRLLVVVALAAALVFVAQSSGGAGGDGSIQWAGGSRSLTEQSCFSGGKVYGYQEVCVSKHGNLISFRSPANFEHLAGGVVYEGYTLCAESTPQGYDVATVEGGFKKATISQPGGPAPSRSPSREQRRTGGSASLRRSTTCRVKSSP
jgi:hypothetical protein